MNDNNGAPKWFAALLLVSFAFIGCLVGFAAITACYWLDALLLSVR